MIKKNVSLLVSNWLQIKNIFQFTPHEINTENGKSKERYRRILLTGGTTAIVKIFSAVINLFTVPLTLHYLGSEQYGLWMAISSFMALMNFADLGLGIGLLNEISRANGLENIRVAQTAVSSTFYMLLAISSVLLCVFLIIYPYVNWPEVFNAQSNAAISESGPTMFVLVIVFLINMPLGVVQRIQDGYQEGFKFQIWQIVGSLISFFGLLLCVNFKTGLPWLVLAFSSGQLIATFLNGYILFSKQRGSLRPRFKYFDFITSKKLLHSGLIYFILLVLTLIGNSSDNIVLAHTMGPTSVAGYEIVKKIFLFSMFTQFIIQPLWPAFGEALAKKEYNWASRTLKKAIKLSVLISAIISLPLLLFGKQIINYWVGPDLVPSWSLLLGFYFYILISNYGGVMSTFLNSGEMVKKQVVIIGLSSISSIFLKVFLSINFGVSGIIWATVIGYSIFYIIPTYKISFNYFKNKQNESFKKNY
jgi:O-antigen/teichoic acid export membrane protein